MKTKILAVAAAAFISIGVAGAATTASADTVATPAVASADKAGQVHNAGIRLRIRLRPVHHPYFGSYYHCKRLLYRWKVLGSYRARHWFYKLNCGRFFY